MHRNDNGTNSGLGLWAVVLLSVFAWAPTTYPGYWRTLEGLAPIFNAQFPAPIARIATVADLWRGTGSAAFLLARPLILLGASPTVAVRVLFAITIVLGALGMYLWLRPRLGDRAAGLAGLIYALAPPVLATVYVRGSLADAWVLALLPLALAGLTVYTSSRSPAGAGVAILALLWMWRTQAGLALFASLALVLYSLWVERDRLALAATVVTSAAGFLSLLPLWAIRGPAPAPFHEHFLAVFQLFGAAWETGPSIPGWQDAYPFQLGFPIVAFSLLAAWLLWRGRGAAPPGNAEVRRLTGFSLALGLVALLLSLGISGSFWQVTAAERLLSYPWQVILIGMPFLAALAGSLPALLPGLACRGYWSALLAIVLITGYPNLQADFVQYTPPDQPVAVFGEHADLVLLEARVHEKTAVQGGVASVDLAWQSVRAMPFDYNLFFQALTADEQGGYRVVAQLDRQPLPERPATTWEPGTIFTTTLRLELPVSPEQVPLRYYLGFYDWRDGSRLPLFGGLDDKVVLYGD
ncbi:MAG: hypothetical protein D6790_09820 [Caldilineae bacterium]|nr:MAG: hypothetical protein D6790_09820 [Caldilineae bacterium]